MKYYRMEPTMKKSVIECDTFSRIDEDGKRIFLHREVGWRWGSWLISVPETQEEIDEYVKSKGFDTIQELAESSGYTYSDEDGNEVMVDGFNLRDILVPDEDNDQIDVSEEYSDAELIETWDGCWEFWNVTSYQVEIPDQQKDIWSEEAEEAYNEDYEAGLEAIGWKHMFSGFELQCCPSIVECDENGEPLTVGETNE
jgi:hypothetical protein